MFKTGLIIAFVLIFLLSACIGSPEISVEGAYALREPAEGGGYVYALFMGIINSGKADDYLTGAEVINHSEARVELHKTVAGKMVPVNEIKIPKGEVVRLAPGYEHIMIFNLSGDFKEIEMDLIFRKSGKLRITAKVREYQPAK